MATVTVSGVVKDETGRKDSRDWKAFSPVYREGSDGEVVTMRKQQVRVVAGMFSAKLDPGVCVLENPDGQRYTVTVPDEDADLWDVIAAAVAFPPDTAQEALAAAVNAWLDANPPGGGGGGGDMLAAVYDPNSIAGDAFSQDKMVAGTINKNYSAAEKAKLAGIAVAATANSTDSALRDRSTHTGTQSADTITDGTTNKNYSAAEKAKLAGIAVAATANSTDASLRDRATHTGSQSASTISDFNTAADARVTAGITGKLDTTAAPELIRDTISTALVAGANVTITPNDAGDTITIAATGGSGGGDFATATRLISSGTGLSGGGDLSADRTLSVLYGAAAGTAVQGNDSRLTRRSLRSYMKPAAAHPFPAAEISSLTLTTSAPSFTGMRYYPWNHADFATKYVKVAGKLVDNGGVGFNIINGASSSMGITGCSLESYISGDRFSFQLQSYGDHDYKLFIDDMPVNLAPTHFSTTASVYFLTVVFTSQRVRKVRLQLGQTGVLQLLTSDNGFIWAAEPRHKVAVIGDSFTHGNGGSTEGSITSGTIAGGLERFAGFDVWNLGQGGTGYSNPGNGTNTAPGPNNVDRFGAASRLAALALLPAMDLIMVVGGANDGDIATYPVATTVGRAQTLWSAIQAARPTTPLIVAGIESGVYPAINADLNTLNDALKAAALAHTGVTAYIDMRNPMWVYGTGKLSVQTGDGNADIFVSSDGVHPSHAGWDYESQRLTTEIAKVLVP